MSAEMVGTPEGEGRSVPQEPAISSVRSRLHSAVKAGNVGQFELAMQTEVGRQFAREQAERAPVFRRALYALAHKGRGCECARRLLDETAAAAEGERPKPVTQQPKKAAKPKPEPSASTRRQSVYGPPKAGYRW